MTGLGFRFIAQQSSKWMNGGVPGSGSAIRSGIAHSGTYAIGKTSSQEGIRKSITFNTVWSI